MRPPCPVRHAAAASGVQIRLEGPEAYDFLEKVGYLLLPNQNAFEGIMDRSISKSGGVGFTWVPLMVGRGGAGRAGPLCWLSLPGAARR